MSNQFYYDGYVVRCKCGHQAVFWKTGYICGTTTAYPCKYNYRRNTKYIKMEKAMSNRFNWINLNLNSRPDFGVTVLLGKKSKSDNKVMVDLGYLE